MAINPETTEWVRALLQQEIERAVAPLRQELDELDDWANGVFAALADVLPLLLRKNPEPKVSQAQKEEFEDGI